MNNHINPYKVGDTVKIKTSWLPQEAKTKRARIIKFQKNDHLIFARVQWIGKDWTKFEEKYGNLFTLDEITKV